ncbi:MAG: hypothetical protein K2O38_00900 [Muribaculaceae bacterium]|nr:hypothetical protein [Muribaculaceae bacterium]
MENTSNDEEIRRMLAEAEERGYNRGINEQLEKQMHTPGVWESTLPNATDNPAAPGFEILANVRRSIWD